MYVMCWACMYVPSMYVCLRERRFMYVWMSQTYILPTKHTYTVSWHQAFGRPLNMYVCLKTLCLSWKWNIHTLSKLLEKQTQIILRHLLSVYVCFKNPLPVMENETYTLKHKPSDLIKNHTLNSSQEALHYVCMFENPLRVMENETYTLEHEL